MKLASFISYAKTFIKKVNTVAEKPFDNTIGAVLEDLQRRSPVDTGMYKSSWKYRESRAGGFLKSVVFYNEDSKFALMEFGAEPNTPPWYYPGAGNRKPSEKLTLAKGKVWAGGLEPGHALTVGGAINPVLEKYRKAKLGEEISEVVLRRI